MQDYNPDPKGPTEFTGSNADPCCQNELASVDCTQTETTVTVPAVP